MQPDLSSSESYPLSIDPWLQSLRRSSSLQLTHSLPSFISKHDLLTFNPFISLVVPDMPEAFYAVLSIYNAFKLVSCNKIVHDEGLSAVSLDSSLAFIMATQGRYPDTKFYSLNRDDWNESRSGIDLRRVEYMFANLEELRIVSMRNNPRGVDICYCSDPSEARLDLAVTVTKIGASLIVRVDTLLDQSLLEMLLSEFSKIVAYKPATSSSVAVEFYLVCMSKSKQSMSTLQDRRVQLESQMAYLEQYRLSCLQSVLERIDNTDRADTFSAKLDYLGL